jgi:NADH-quinone oxidoreductase subunit M
MVNHGLATGALFLVAGMLAERTHTRSFEMFGGLWRQTPVMGAFLLFFAFASLGIPGTGNFIGELYVIGGAFTFNPWLGVVTGFGVLFAAIYSLRVFLATMHGVESSAFKKLSDTSARENVALGSLAAALVLIGFVPSVVTGQLFLQPDNTVPVKGRDRATIASRSNVPPALPPALPGHAIPASGHGSETSMNNQAHPAPEAR